MISDLNKSSSDFNSEGIDLLNNRINSLMKNPAKTTNRQAMPGLMNFAKN